MSSSSKTHSVEIEQSLLGSLLIRPETFDQCHEIAETDFYRREHLLIFRAAHALYNEQQLVDVITVSDRLEKTGDLKNVGGLSYVAQLANNTPSATNAHVYARLVKQYSQTRSALAVLQEAVASVQSEGLVAVGPAIAMLMDVFAIDGSRVCELHEAALLALESVEKIQKRGHLAGIATGLKEFDSKVGGLHDSDLIVIGGRPAMGKTSILLNLAWHSGVPTGIFTAEQPSIQLGQRALAMIARVNGKRYRNASLDSDEFARSIQAYKQMKEKHIYLYDKTTPSMEEVFHQARRWKRERDIKLIGVDYIQRIDTQGDTREERIEEVVMRLKGLARELRVPVVALSSVNRDVEKRPDKRPTMADFKGSGAIESEADVAIALYRDEVYNNKESNKGIAELIILKSRNGPIGYIECAWRDEFMVFEDL